ncbi:stage IV sporulation protein FA [Fontibacillus panacisegetis]|uniref:Stage IV sporulation protein FA n=1 Tax=Fontibacillus panacisegetis TaxID=670482 RepID=A0A1G7JKR3_9BACL|nr:M23 family metallopeptidase [Fontibacillus panacisegetis]SDF25538.1 stage IV sporulation protein FA [Fontibacillus panacisegetis]
MNVKSNVKKRREERIRQLTAADAARAALPGWSNGNGTDSKWMSVTPATEHDEATESDPEFLWKRGQGRWTDISSYGSRDIEDGGRKRKHSSFWSMMFIKLVISAALFVGIWGINQYEPAWAFPIRIFVADALTKEMDFAAAEVWYERTFGGPPSFIPIFKHNEDKSLKVGSSNGFSTPMEGTLAGSFALSLKGVEIIPDQEGESSVQVKSTETGRVVSVSRDALTGMTVVIQHAGGYESLYGHLDEPFVEKGDWVESGDVIGVLPSKSSPPYATLYFALKINDRYIDPAELISFD